MAKFRRKAMDVEAQQFFPDRKPWPEGVIELLPHWKTLPNAPRRFHLTGGIGITPGDWVVMNQTGERYVVFRESFAKTYEQVIF